MTGALLASGARGDTQVHPNRVPIEVRIEDSLRSIAMPIRDVSAVMVGVLVGSLAVHAILLATAVVTGRAPLATPPNEIAVEIVQDMPKPPPPAPPPAPPKAQLAKLEMPKSEPVKPEPVKPEPAKLEPAKLEVAKPAPPPQPAAPPKAPPAKPVIAKAPPPRPPASPATPGPDAQQIAALQKELDDLRAQRAALQTEAPAPDLPPADRGSGALTGSSRAVALPSIGEDGEAVGYQDLVFSQLAKAKGVGDYRGPAGTTGVRFKVDDTGRLLSVEVAVSSGSASLDQKALDIVRRAAPFPPPPKESDHSFVANVNFVPPKP